MPIHIWKFEYNCIYWTGLLRAPFRLFEGRNDFAMTGVISNHLAPLQKAAVLYCRETIRFYGILYPIS